jgi:NAD(P)H dehydrogenase (quinone)
MYAIVGAAGKVGYSTSRTLREADVPVRAILRDAAKSSPLREIGCEIAIADLQDPASLSRALANAQAVQVILPVPAQAEDAPGEMRRSIESVAQALERAPADLVLAISDYGAHIGEGIGMPTLFHAFETRLRGVKMSRVFLRSAEHMEGWGLAARAAIASGVLPSLHHPVENAFPTVSAQDVGVIAARLLLQRDTRNVEQIVHAEGPGRYSATDVAAALSELSGRTITAQAIPRSQWQKSLQRVMSASAAQLLVDVYDAHNKGGLIDVEPHQGEIRYGSTQLIDALRPIVRHFPRP